MDNAEDSGRRGEEWLILPSEIAMSKNLRLEEEVAAADAKILESRRKLEYLEGTLAAEMQRLDVSSEKLSTEEEEITKLEKKEQTLLSEFKEMCQKELDKMVEVNKAHREVQAMCRKYTAVISDMHKEFASKSRLENEMQACLGQANELKKEIEAIKSATSALNLQKIRLINSQESINQSGLDSVGKLLESAVAQLNLLETKMKYYQEFS